MAAKGVIKGIVTVAVIGALGAGGWFAYRHFVPEQSARTEKVYVQRVANVNAAGTGDLFANCFSGVIVAQKTVSVKYDTSKTIGEILVSEGDSVKKGDKLLTYNIEAIQIEIDTAKLEVEGLQNSIQTNEAEIAQLEKEKRTATGDAQVSYTTKILSLQSDNARSEYDIKTKNVEIAKLENSLNNAFVTAPIDGTVKELKDGAPDPMSENPDVIMKITADGDFRVQGTFNEQNAMSISKGAEVILRSRVDDTTRKGEISDIDEEPISQEDPYGMMRSDPMTSSSKYAFYVKPESLEGFRLGQHLVIEMDRGDEDEKRTGVWLYDSFVMWDGKENYVWAKNDRDRIEKRIVEIGEHDEERGESEIKSGLSPEDYIAVSADYIEAGMGTTTNLSEAEIPEDASGMPADGAYPADAVPGGEEADFDAAGNLVYTDGEGDVYTFDPDGELIDGEGKLFDEENAEADEAENEAENDG